MERRHITPAIWTENENGYQKSCRARFFSEILKKLWRGSGEKAPLLIFGKAQKQGTGTWKNEVKKSLKKILKI